MERGGALESDALLKAGVRSYWESDPCDLRYGRGSGASAFEQLRRKRYELEPAILEFADFSQGEGKRILEIGTGIGVDFLNWLRHGANGIGVDITARALEITRKQLDGTGVRRGGYGLSQADAEKLPFRDSAFDVVYSWGVLHHTPGTGFALEEAFRVLVPGGTLKVMVYHVPSWTGWLLWLRHGLLKGRPFSSAKEMVWKYLESPGTKAYTSREIRHLLASTGFTDIDVRTALGPSDLLLIELSDKYQSFPYRAAKALYPRWLVRRIGDRYGLLLLTEARKPPVRSPGQA